MTNQKINFEEHVKKEMKNVVKTHQHNHPLYQETRIDESIIDEDKKRAAFVLFEQIDTDRCTPEGQGYLGDQYRYSLWIIEGNKKPRQLYEDHAYIRASKSGLTGTRGRDCRINLEALADDGVIAGISPEEGEGTAYTMKKVKINLEGRAEEPDDFIDKAKNLVTSIGARLGYDYLKDVEQLQGKNIATLVWGTENGSTYGYDTVYLVWKDKKGKIRHEEITNSRSTKDYLSVQQIRENKDNVVVKIKDYEYKIPKKGLN